jgi:hypothetical protein
MSWALYAELSVVRYTFRDRGKTKQAIIADQCSLKPVTGIACEFGARRRSPPHSYSIVAPTARRILVPCPKRLLQHYPIKSRLSTLIAECPLCDTFGPTHRTQLPALFDYQILG